MDSIRVKSYAKINLSLDILGVKDGYHAIDSVVTNIDVFDVVRVCKRKKDKLVNVFMRGMGSELIPAESNNAAIAAEMFVQKYGVCGADIYIDKNIPMGAGLGGSSADAAGVLNALSALHGIDDFDGVKSLADATGSDTGYMLSGGYARITDRGQVVQPLDCRLRLDLILLLPKEGVSTGRCYALSDEMPALPRTSDGVERALCSGDRRALGAALSNGLFPAAARLNPQVARAAEELSRFAPLGVNMSGSGSCVYALFENDSFSSYALSRYKGDCRAMQVKTYIPKRS